MSTHFLDEAEQMCRRVVVLNDGTVVALSSPEDLVQGEPNQTRLNAEIYGSCVQISGELAKLTNVLSVSCCPSAGRNAANESEPAWRRYTIECGGRSDIRLDIFDVARRNGWKLRDLSLQKKRLGDFFVEMTAGGGKS